MYVKGIRYGPTFFSRNASEAKKRITLDELGSKLELLREEHVLLLTH
mgnify:CR=1 FL=1